MVNQEFGFFYHRYRKQWGNKPPIFLVKDEDITGQIDGFAYGREAIPLNREYPQVAVSAVLWGMKNTFSLNRLELPCQGHVAHVEWPEHQDCENAATWQTTIQYTCPDCDVRIDVDPYMFQIFQGVYGRHPF